MNALFLIALGLVTAAVAAPGCSSNRIQLCGQIPLDGCPLGRGGTCDDETCAALYNCVSGNWVLDRTCEQTSGGSGGGGGGEGGAGMGGCNGVEIDRTGEAISCSPPLQDPDCPAAAAELCRPCETGCFDFFLCKDDGWAAVAFCDEDGNVVVEP